MKLVKFCQAVSSQSNIPGQKVNLVRLLPVGDTPANGSEKAKPGPNASLFSSGNVQGSFDIANLTDEAAAEFSAGKRYIVEIREAGPND